jgi:hypothetical protein
MSCIFTDMKKTMNNQQVMKPMEPLVIPLRFETGPRKTYYLPSLKQASGYYHVIKETMNNQQVMKPMEPLVILLRFETGLRKTYYYLPSLKQARGYYHVIKNEKYVIDTEVIRKGLNAALTAGNFAIKTKIGKAR